LPLLELTNKKSGSVALGYHLPICLSLVSHHVGGGILPSVELTANANTVWSLITLHIFQKKMHYISCHLFEDIMLSTAFKAQVALCSFYYIA
jgi:hypothetical protein